MSLVEQSALAGAGPVGPVLGDGAQVDGIVEVAGAPVHYTVSGSGNRDLLLVHGYRAHRLWWHRLLPTLEAHWRVIRLDLSGHGDSGHRDHYSLDGWTAELIAVLDAVGSEHALLAGHSMGGRLAAVACAEHEDRFGALLLFDALLLSPSAPRLPASSSLPPGQELVYRTREAAVARFQLRPVQPQLPVEVLGPVAEFAVRPSTSGQGWTWKFDQSGRPPIDNDRVAASLARMRQPVWFVRGGRSTVVTDEAAEYLQTVLPADATFVTLPDACHHLILDTPDECLRLLTEVHGDLVSAIRPHPVSAAPAS